jgi:ATP synthase protein I
MSMTDKPEPLAEDSSGAKSKDGALGALTHAGSLIQIALLLPAATVIGWAMGVWLDHLLNQHWIYIVGLLAGAGAGFVQIFRVILALSKE